jgi:iron complex outermembrane receptor protein
VNASAGRYIPDDFEDDGTTVNVNGGWGIGLGRGSLGLFAEFLDRQPTNRAWADPFDLSGSGVADLVDSEGNVVVKRNPVPQPNHHWGDGLEKDVLTMANFRMPLNDAGTSEIYGFGGYGFREGTGNGYRRYADSDRNWPQIYPVGFLPEFNPDVTDYSLAGGVRGAPGGWTVDVGASFGHNDFEYNLRNTLNASLGPCLDLAPAVCPPANVPPAGIPNQTSFFAGQLTREEVAGAINIAKAFDVGLPGPLNLAFGAAVRRERFEITQGEYASYVDGGHPNQFGDDAPGGSQVFPGFAPDDTTNASRSNFGFYADLETNLTPEFLVDVAGRFESYSDFGERLTGKLALRYQPSTQVTLRAAASTGFRAPGLGQSHFSKVVTNVIGGEFIEVGVFPVEHPAAELLGSRRLQEETSVNLSAGFAVSPVESFNLTADYFFIKIDDRILLGATFDDAVTVAILQGAGFTSIGGVQYFTNGLDTRTQGVDVTATLEVPVGVEGTLDLTGVLNYTKNEITRVAPLPPVLQGSEEEGLLDLVTQVGIEEERPELRWTATAEYSVGRFHSLGRASYFGGFASAQPSFTDREEFGAKTLFDLEAGYRFDQIDLSLGVRNIFDTFPDRAQAEFNNNFGTFPWAAASPFGYNGRYIYTRAAVQLVR